MTQRREARSSTTAPLARRLASAAMLMLSVPAVAMDDAGRIGTAPPRAERAAPLRFDIPAGPLAGAVADWERASGLTLVAATETLEGRATPGVHGELDPQAALMRLLSGTSLVHRMTDAETAVVIRADWSAAPGAGEEDAVVLDQLSVEGRGDPSAYGAAGGATGPVPGYVASRSAVATKTDTPILRTPQSISVISRKQIEDTNALTLTEALRYTPGVATDQRGAVGSTRVEQINIRGFAAPQFLDGLRLPTNRDAYPSVDPFRLERVDIIKGPASVLYGQSGPGGLVNFVSKVPQFVRHGEVFVQGGGFDEVRGGVDVGGPLEIDGIPSEQFAYRVIASGRAGDGAVDTTRVERAFIAPSLTWRPDADTNLTVLGLYQRDPFGGYFGSTPAFGSVFASTFAVPGGPLRRLPVSFYNGDPNYERSDRTQSSVSYILDHRFDAGLRFHSAARYLDSEGSYRSVISGLVPSTLIPSDPVRTFARNRLGADVSLRTFTIDNNLQFDLSTGPLQHTLLLGIDHQTIRTRTLATSTQAVAPIDLLNPTYGLAFGPLPFTSDQDLTATQTGVYAQDQIRLDRLSLIVGGRYDVARQSGPSRTIATGAVTGQDAPASAFTGRAGLIYTFDSGFAPYVSYSEAFEPIVSGAIFDGNPNGLGRIPDPITSRQYEVGIKYQPPGTTILLTAAAFDIKRQNSLSPDPVNGTRFSIQTGEATSQGVEFEARANLWEGFDLIGGFSLLDLRNTGGSGTTVNELTRASVPLLGRRPIAVPDTTVSLFANHRVLSGTFAGVGIGGGVRYLGSSWGDSANTLRVPSSLLVDAVASYDFRYLAPSFTGMELSLNVTNLLDERYVNSCFDYRTCFNGLPRTVFATLRYRW